MSDQSVANVDSRDQLHRDLQRLERRRLWMSVALPFFMAMIVVMGFVGVTLSLRSPAQVAILSDSMLTLLVLFPLVICLFPLVILSLALVALMSRWHSRSRSPLRRLEAWTTLMENNVERWLGSIDEGVLEWAVRLAPLRQLLTAFDPPASESQEEGEA